MSRWRRRRRRKLLRPPSTKEGAGVKQPVLLRSSNNQQGGEEGVQEQATPRHLPWQPLQVLGFPGQEDLTLQGLITRQASPQLGLTLRPLSHLELVESGAAPRTQAARPLPITRQLLRSR